MRNAQISRRNTNTVNVLTRMLGTTKVTVDLSAEGVVVPVCPTEGTITLDLNLATRDLRGCKSGFSAVYNFCGATCGIFVPLAAIRNVEFVPAANEVVEAALRLAQKPAL